MNVERPNANSALPPLRERIFRGAAGQGMAVVSRILVQLAMAGVLLPTWGLQLYGEWLTIVGIALLAGSSDFGILSAAGSDMAISVGKGDLGHARDTFRAVALGLVITIVAAMAAVLTLGFWAPLDDWLGLEVLTDTSAAVILALVAAEAMCLMLCLLFAAGPASDGHYGEVFAILGAVYFFEWVAAAGAAAAGQGPVVATAVLLAVRVAGTVAMYVYMRRRVPWLSLGRPSRKVHVRKRLMRPAMAGAGIGWGTAINIQAMIVLVGVVVGPASAAIFATVRTVSRIVITLATAIGPAVGPEFARAFGEGDQVLLRRLQRHVSQLGVWSAVALVAVLAVVGDELLSVITRETVSLHGPLLIILLIGAVFEVAWVTSGAILFATNRHQRVGLMYVALSTATLGLAYLLVPMWGVDGAAVSVLVLSVVMVFVMLRDSLRATGDTVGAWVKSLVDPRELLRAVAVIRSRA